MGLWRDINLREKLRKYLLDKVTLAREWIYEQGYKIRGEAVERLLKETSSVPTLVNLFFCTFILFSDN